METQPARTRLACMDMAGTVVNGNGVVLEAFRRALVATGVEGPELDKAMEYAHQTMGLPKFVVFGHLLLNDDRVNEALAQFSAAIDDAIAQGRVTEIPGARHTIDELRNRGIVVCLTTGFSTEVQDAIIGHLGWRDAVDFSIAPGPALRGRPFPDMVLTAALRAGVDDVREVAVVGDTANDLLAGYRAGAAVVAGVLTGSHDRAELETAPHTDILSSIVEFPGVLL